ncbi:MAG: hypothetical protein CXX83_00805 [Methanobacteriota archaeon]|nr:MAG: hypothetical protein CXX83_02410 [Euryarchaeota archaeon]PXY71077.1 MAG: hypothetical protein CXX83_00805 [Euryarchaeota archaeon]
MGRSLSDILSGEQGDWKAEQFERLWHGRSAKGENPVKASKFRQYIREHVRQKIPDVKSVSRRRDQRKEGSSGHMDESRYFSKEYCRKYWMGELQAEIREAESY